MSKYKIGKTEVTQELYKLVMGENPSHWSYPNPKRPVERVSWFEAVAFCNELTRCTPSLGRDNCVYTYEGRIYTVQDARSQRVPKMDMRKEGFRLPTEAEWEWAAQSGDNRQKWAGTNDHHELGEYAWYKENIDDSTSSSGVGQKKINPYGLYDMTGNVWEWCWDWHSENDTPAGGTNPIGASSGTNRAIRGGSYNTYFPRDLSCAYRDVSLPPKDFESNVGFRIVFDPDD